MIESRDNLKIKQYIRLSSKKSCRDKLGKFVLEGVRILHDALKYGVTFDNIFITEKCIFKIKNTNYDITNLCNYDIISEKIANYMASVSKSQGVFAIANKPTTICSDDIFEDDFVLALYDVQDPGNVGTLIRTADAFGFNKIVLSNSCDIYNPKVVRSTMGSLFRSRFLKCENFERLLDDVNIRTYATVVKQDAVSLSQLTLNKGAMLILGNEANGLPDNIVKKCDVQLTIDMLGETESLNAAVAGSICMYKFRERLQGSFNE